ncbi:MAG: ferrochelatase [Lysobacter sp.]|nr:ferrochelatase [Lysobacter sp.]
MRMPAPDTAVLLVNLGTPEAPTPAAVRRYLAEFLSDPRVVALPALLWQPLLRAVILPLRGMRVAEKYASVWLPGGSPLAVHTRALADAVQLRLPQWRVACAMRYGTPPLREALEHLRAVGARRVLVLPLYPQYSTTTTASVADVAATVPGIDAVLVDDYHADARWVAAVAGSVREHRQTHGDVAHLLFSFHGLPQRLIDAGDPYQVQCEASARAIASALGLVDGAWSLAYQSRFGRERWLGPSTAEALDALAARGVRTVDVACPGFAVDCLETLEEVATMLATRFRERGGTLRYVPCLNATPAHADALAAIACRALGGTAA